MSTAQTQIRTLKPGSNGWMCDDLDSPELEAVWEEESIELINGVVSEMAAKYYQHAVPLTVVAHLLMQHFEDHAVDADVGVGEIDLQISQNTRFKVDALVLTGADREPQRRRQEKVRPGKEPFGVIVIPPTIVIESISPGHEKHDWVTKREAFARFGVPNYWIIDAFARKMSLLKLYSGEYVIEAEGSGDDILKPAVFPGLKLPMNKVFR